MCRCSDLFVLFVSGSVHPAVLNYCRKLFQLQHDCVFVCEKHNVPVSFGTFSCIVSSVFIIQTIYRSRNIRGVTKICRIPCCKIAEGNKYIFSRSLQLHLQTRILLWKRTNIWQHQREEIDLLVEKVYYVAALLNFGHFRDVYSSNKPCWKVFQAEIISFFFHKSLSVVLVSSLPKV